MSFEYLLILFLIFLSAVFIHWQNRLRLFESRRHFAATAITVIAMGAVWDTIGAIRGFWSFPGRGVVGVTIFDVPIEEYVMFAVVGYWILVMYRWLGKRLP